MKFAQHSGLEGKHSFLSPSKHYWINYSPEKLKTSYQNFKATQRGTELHDFAKRCIQLGERLPRSNRTLNLYVNDAIKYHMIPEQPLYFSINCFGTADAISFDESLELLRIHDLKTGESPVSMDQLMVYAAIFCLEYKKDPSKIEIELRIYQKDAVLVHSPDPENIASIMQVIKQFDAIIESMKGDE